jgi:hypothetical protein
LGRLDQSGIPGLKLRGLLTLHTLERLRRDTDRWASAIEVTRSISRTADWRAIMTRMGYQVERRPRPGYLVRWRGNPIAVVHAMRDSIDLSRLDADGRPPEGSVLNDCRADGAPYGLLATGATLRLFDADPAAGSAASSESASHSGWAAAPRPHRNRRPPARAQEPAREP